ncbi:MAG: hydroxyacylglutathione hydrolase [Gammaproteobacteria bacterium]|nr:hydroxyacylglutathione hydrolase [Gammaproteobacteria bacterium]
MLEVTPIKAFNDNYLWLFRQPESRDCGIVDPGDAEPVLRHLQDNGLNLAVILITHHHADHTGGIQRLIQDYDVPVYGPASANIPAVTHTLSEGDSIEVLGESFRVYEIPGHTLDHIAYYADSTEDEPVLFCGDTLFAAGCGRVFEGTHSMMHASLQKLAELAPASKVYCAHEYTLANLAFAKAVSPDNATLADRIRREQTKRDQDIPTVPTSIGVELSTNPFLRCSEEEIVAAASRQIGRMIKEPVEVFAAIRGWKDTF